MPYGRPGNPHLSEHDITVIWMLEITDWGVCGKTRANWRVEKTTVYGTGTRSVSSSNQLSTT